jgi:hypothetical protein
MMRDGYGVHACTEGGELQALCFEWPTPPDGNHVHGLQFVTDFEAGYAEAVVSSATADVVAAGQVAFCGCVPTSDKTYSRIFRNVGFRPFYRVHSFLGIKRGIGKFARVSPHAFFSSYSSAA